MKGRRIVLPATLTLLSGIGAGAQLQCQTPGDNSSAPVVAPAESPRSENVPLTVPKGTAIQVIIDKELKVEKVGQPVRGRVVEPLYAFDKLVVPAGTEVTGEITQLEEVSNGKRTLDALNADLSPARRVAIQFDTIALGDGKSVAVKTIVTRGSGQVMEFVSAGRQKSKRSPVDIASEKAEQAENQAKQELRRALAQVKEPGRIHRGKRYLLAQFPIHSQYIDPGTVYFAELQAPLDFGTEPLTPEMEKSIGVTPPEGSLVQARLSTELSSATARKGDPVEATLSRPLFDGKELIFPQGSRLKGSVVEVRPARHLSRNGQLRLAFREIAPPEGIAQTIQANLKALESAKRDDVGLDTEGGAEAQTPKKRYLQTSIAIGLAAASSGDDGLNRVEGGAGGFRVVGIVLGAVVRSQPLGLAMGALGASRSIYVHFIARGHDVNLLKNTGMEIEIGTRPEPPSAKLPEETVQR
jgi:hypothetical protein